MLPTIAARTFHRLNVRVRVPVRVDVDVDVDVDDAEQSQRRTNNGRDADVMCDEIDAIEGGRPSTVDRKSERAAERAVGRHSPGRPPAFCNGGEYVYVTEALDGAEVQNA